MTVPEARGLWLRRAGGEAAFGYFDEAVSGGGVAAVIVPPFGWEEICSYRARRVWAKALAADGCSALRLDLPGSGDATGSPRDPERLQAWTDAVADAVAWLRAETGSTRVAAIGIGLGGLLALRAREQGTAIDDLLLWAVPARGRTLARELRAFTRLAAIEPPTDASYDGDGLVVNGYLLSRSTLAALNELDLTAAIPPADGGRALLLGRDDAAPDAALAEALTTAGFAVSAEPGPGYAAMMVEPQQSRPPQATIERSLRWVREGAGALAVAVPPASAVPEALGRVALTPLPAHERPLAYSHDGIPLHGIVTEPDGAAGPLGMLLVNAGPQRRVGPNRMWVEIARRWAPRAVPSLRVDLESIGEAGGAEARYTETGALYEPHFVAQVERSLDMIEETVPGRRRYALLGLCSGAYWSLHAAARDDRVASVVLLNPAALVFDAYLSSARHARDLRGLVLRASTWRRLLRGELDLRNHLGTARVLAGRLLARLRALPARLLRPADVPAPTSADQALELLDLLRDRGVRLLFLFSGGEPLREQLAAEGFFEQLDRWPQLEVAIVGTDTLTHTLQPGWLQREVNEVLDRFLADELRRAGGDGAAAVSAADGGAAPAAGAPRRSDLTA